MVNMTKTRGHTVCKDGLNSVPLPPSPASQHLPARGGVCFATLESGLVLWLVLTKGDTV